MRYLSRGLAAGMLTAVLAAAVPAGAQTNSALSGFQTESDEPVHIESDVLEVFDREGMAEFSGNVVVVQGPTTLRTHRLKVFYTSDREDSTPAPEATGQNITRLEATGDVVVVSGEQRATGDWAIFEMATQEVTLGGSVVLSEGENVVRGSRLVVNLETGRSQLHSEPGQQGSGRVQGLFIPRSRGQIQD